MLPDRVLLGAIAVVVLYGAVEHRRPGAKESAALPTQRELLINAALIGFGVGLLGWLTLTASPPDRARSGRPA